MAEWQRVVADCETNGLLDELTTIHCLVLRDLDTDEVLSCAEQPGYAPLADGLRILANAEKTYFHNGIRFDYPALRKVYPAWDMDRSRIMDTFIVACMRWAHIKDRDYAQAKAGAFPGKLAGSHSLEAWGYRLGLLKGDFKKGADWATWTLEMQTYCEQDTAVTKALVLKIREAGVSPESVEIEQSLAWYLAAQERGGIPFDVNKAVALQARLAARRQVVEQELIQTFGSWEKPDGVLIPKRDNKRLGYTKGVPVHKIKTVTFNPGSRQHIAERLTALYGWEPTEFTPSGQPEVNEKTLQGLNEDIPAVKLLLEYLLLEKRLGQIAEGKEAWLKRYTTTSPEGAMLTGLPHIHHRVKQNFAITHRASHANPNLAQVPKVGSPFGAECRELFYVPDGWVMVGADASSLEARCLAHYMARYDGGAYGKLLLEGDVHTANRIALGLPEGKAERDKAKVFLYALLYGAGDEKLGNILGVSKGAGGMLKKEFLKNTPALKHLVEDVQLSAKEKGYLLAPDGRRVYVRSEHAALNSLLQCAGSIIVKRWLANAGARMEREHGPQGWKEQWTALLYIHDELEWAVRPELADWTAQMLVEEIEKLTEHFRWRVRLAGEAKVGQSWRSVH